MNPVTVKSASKQPSVERGCTIKARLGRNYVKESDKLAKKWGKRYLVYRCPHCGNAHLTTKLKNRDKYGTEVLHVTP